MFSPTTDASVSLVVDRYERTPGVINADVLEFEVDGRLRPDREHLDARARRLGRAPARSRRRRARLAHLNKLLTPGGRLVVTLPVGYNPHLDAAIRERRLALSELRALRREERATPGGRWIRPRYGTRPTTRCYAPRTESSCATVTPEPARRAWPARKGGRRTTRRPRSRAPRRRIGGGRDRRPGWRRSTSRSRARSGSGSGARAGVAQPGRIRLRSESRSRPNPTSIRVAWPIA